MLAKIRFFVNIHKAKIIQFSIIMLLITLAFAFGFIFGAKILEPPEIIIR